jgi:hypothetical protein
MCVPPCVPRLSHRDRYLQVLSLRFIIQSIGYPRDTASVHLEPTASSPKHALPVQVRDSGGPASVLTRWNRKAYSKALEIGCQVRHGFPSRSPRADATLLSKLKYDSARVESRCSWRSQFAVTFKLTMGDHSTELMVWCSARLLLNCRGVQLRVRHRPGPQGSGPVVKTKLRSWLPWRA